MHYHHVIRQETRLQATHWQDKEKRYHHCKHLHSKCLTERPLTRARNVRTRSKRKLSRTMVALTSCIPTSRELSLPPMDVHLTIIGKLKLLPNQRVSTPTSTTSRTIGSTTSCPLERKLKEPIAQISQVKTILTNHRSCTLSTVISR